MTPRGALVPAHPERYDRAVKCSCIVLAACASSPAPRATPTPELAVGPVVACPSPTPAIRDLVAKLDADADHLHVDSTPAVTALAELGVAGGCAALGALASPDAQPRLHAERVVEGVLARRHDFRPGRGYPDQYAEEYVATTLRVIDYHHDGAPEARTRGIARWQLWLEHPQATLDVAVGGPAIRELRAALDAVRPALVACGEPVDLTVTFGGSGHVESIWGTARTDLAYRECLQTATKAIAIAPFGGRASVWIRYDW